jgi:hypothetical protein
MEVKGERTKPSLKINPLLETKNEKRKIAGRDRGKRNGKSLWNNI